MYQRRIEGNYNKIYVINYNAIDTVPYGHVKRNKGKLHFSLSHSSHIITHIHSLFPLLLLWVCMHLCLYHKGKDCRLLLLSHFSHVQLFTTPWTAAHQASPSMGFSRQEYWSELPLFTPKDLIWNFIQLLITLVSLEQSINLSLFQLSFPQWGH